MWSERGIQRVGKVKGRTGKERSRGNLLVSGDTVLGCDGCWFAPSVKHLPRHRRLDSKCAEPPVFKKLGPPGVVYVSLKHCAEET